MENLLEKKNENIGSFGQKRYKKTANHRPYAMIISYSVSSSGISVSTQFADRKEILRGNNTSEVDDDNEEED